MSVILKCWEYITLVYKYVRFKIRQNRLKTDETFVVVTTYGPIKGVKRRTIWNVPFYSFEKIPFAKPPIGELRFKAPVPPDPWEEVKDCTAEGPIPLQTNLISKRIEGSEDCLYLNVYTKNLNPERLMPVMIWIYGGGFETGGATKDLYSPDYFMEKDVVLITINYRVGPFGFLVFDDPDLNIPGNAGLKDQVLALKWIKANCMNFGGDSNNITVFGESAGAASTHYMMLTDQTKGLFHKSILMSGSIYCPWALVPNIQSGYRLAKALRYNGSNINDNACFEYIKNAKGKDILHAERYVLNDSDKNKRILFPFGPVIEPYITNDCIIPEHPRIMIRKAWSINIPMIIGGTANEGLIMLSGFLSLKDPDLCIPGNAGLKDQVLALKWIRANCMNFGGNEFNTTLFGQEAGAASAHYMMLCDRTRGLFHKAILMSGNVFCQWAINKQRNIAYRLARRMGYNGDNNDKKIYEFIKNMDGKKFVKAAKTILSDGEKRKKIFSPFGPVIEPYSTVQCVLRRSPIVKLRRAWGNQIPLLIGGTSFEGLLYYKEAKHNPDVRHNIINFTDLIPLDLNVPYHSSEAQYYAQRLRGTYFEICETKRDNINNYMDLMSYKMFWHPIYRTILSRSKHSSNNNTYLYRFDIDSPTFNLSRSVINCDTLTRMRGVCHGDDVGYLFANAFSDEVESNSNEYQMINEFLDAFTNFAETSNPNLSTLNEVNNQKFDWKPCNPMDPNLKCYNFNFNSAVITLPEMRDIDVWNNFYPSNELI